MGNFINVKDFGATGNGITDDTRAIQSALDYAADHGGYVFLPIGVYRTTKPLTLTWEEMNGQSKRPLIAGIVGEGHQTVIMGTIDTDGEAVLQLLGTSNTYSVDMVISDFRIRMKKGSSGAYCLRVGDCKNSFEARRVKFHGANGALLRVGLSATYAQINTVFNQCEFYSNYANEWWPNDQLAKALAVNYEKSTAKWDNVKFQSCMFMGLVKTRASICEFDNCQFSTNPRRPLPDRSGNYAANVLITVGNAKFSSCYFEDHREAVVIGNGLSHINNISFDGCHFSGITNYKDAQGKKIHGDHAIDIQEYPTSYKIGSITITNCYFGDYNIAAIHNRSSVASVKADNLSFLNDPTLGFKVLGKVQPLKSEWITFTGELVDDKVVIPTFNGISGLSNYKVDYSCWISRVKFILHNKIVSGDPVISIFKNSVEVSKAAFSSYVNKTMSSSSEIGTLYNPVSTYRLCNASDEITVSVNPDGLTSLPAKFEVWIELGY